jgi:hypothetical protein
VTGDKALNLGERGQAEIGFGLLKPYGMDSLEPPQVEALGDLTRRHTVDAVLVSVGANDIGFARIVQFCILNLAGPCW